MEMRKFERAKDDLTRAIAVAPENAAYQEKLGTVLIELKDWSAPRRRSRRPSSVEPTLFKAYYKLAQVSEELDDQQSALAALHASRSRRARASCRPTTRWARCMRTSATSITRSRSRRARSRSRSRGSEEAAKIHNLLGTVYQQQQKFDEATQEFRAALEIVPGMRDAVFSLGWTYALQGNKEEAKRYLKKFLAVAGDAPAALPEGRPRQALGDVRRLLRVRRLRLTKPRPRARLCCLCGG